MIPRYPKIYRPDANNHLDSNPYVEVQEKIDGSQFSFKKNERGEMLFRSKNRQIFPGEAGMFEAGVKSILDVAKHIPAGFVFRGEYLAKPRHNGITYQRIPRNHVILWDASADGAFYDFRDSCLGDIIEIFDWAPLYYEGYWKDCDHSDFMNRESILGGPIEGYVVKDYSSMDPASGKFPLCIKYVSEAFKEVQGKTWKQDNLSQKDIIQRIGNMYQTEARWQKAVQHLREDGKLSCSTADIGPLIHAVHTDILEECSEEMKGLLLSWAWKKAARITTAGLADWYKERLDAED